MTQDINFFAEDPGRYERFQQEFKAQNILGDLINEVFDQYNSKLNMRDGNERDLSILVAAAFFGKAQKTFQTIMRLCALGCGEDAIVLLRSNIRHEDSMCGPPWRDTRVVAGTHAGGCT